MKCPRRSGVPCSTNFPEEDQWREDHTCSFCGSLSPDKFFEAIENGEKIGPTDKGYKVYVGSAHKKFYFQHLNDEQRDKFIRLHNDKKINIGFPHYFYVRPYFTKPVETNSGPVH